MKARPEDQLCLVEVAALDAAIENADRARRNPAQTAQVQALLAERQTLSTELTALLGARDDLATELRRIESDVEVVDARSARDTERLSATSNVKEAQGLEREIESLAKRKSDLEDAQLDVMDRLEAAGASVEAQEAEIARVNTEGARLSAEGKAAVAEATARMETAVRDRAALVGTIPADLLATYDRVAARSAGAAVLRQRTCEGCRMVLAGTDLQAIRQAAEDDVVFCPECGCILVRTEDSGL